MNVSALSEPDQLMKIDYVAVAAANDIPAGAYKNFDVNGRKILVVHLADRFTAVENRCSHAGSSFAGPIVRGNQIACPIHGARFDLVTGAPKCPPAFQDIAVFPVRVVDGQIEVAVPPRR